VSREYPERPLVGIGVVVLRPDAVLLARRGNPPNVGAWSLPGGAQELGETAEEAARRELAEETGLQVGSLHFAAIVDIITPGRDARPRFHFTVIDYAAVWQGEDPHPGGDTTELAWVGFDEYDQYQLWSEARRVIDIARTLLHSPRAEKFQV
jgi:ADP-ribose pyrophosphatase YjhB (NUDIX family)